MAGQVLLSVADYVVTVIMLLVPLGIGVLFAFKDAKKATRDEYLLGGRQMSMLPVTLSLFVTFQSAISVMGVPSDIYNYGVMFIFVYGGFCISYVIGYFTTVPLMFSLHLTSVYEYLEMRYRSRTLRMFSMGIGMFQTLFYMAIVQLTPALALQAAAGIPLWLSVAIIGVIGTVYTTIGGIKSVIWTDAFQCAVMLVGVLSILITGSTTVGGMSNVINICQEKGRLDFSRTSPDLRERNTWMATLIGGTFMWLANLCNQSTIQRISAMKTVKDAKNSYIINILLTAIYGTLLLLVGLVVFAYFEYMRCDPYDGGFITNRNQMVPYFAIHALKDAPGMAGFFMATLFSGSLSTLSSGINALAANTVEDILKRTLSSYSEAVATRITKVIVCVYGIIIVGLAYAANTVKGPVSQIGLSVIGGCGGPILGVFMAGAAVPWVNKRAALIAQLSAIGFTVWISIGNQIYGRKVKILPPPPTDMCYANATSVSDLALLPHSGVGAHNISVMSSSSSNTVATSSSVTVGDDQILDPYAFGFYLYDISYEWYAVIGTVISFFGTVLLSIPGKASTLSKVNSKLIFPISRRYWSLPEPHHTPADESNIDAIENLKLSNLKINSFKDTEFSLEVNQKKEVEDNKETESEKLLSNQDNGPNSK
ncbi:sodium-coupled monocarboxylate transporter 1-like [Aplysia californica]|uniref:Sodium-coupled monocarboxylate transporter 1-like n=1 Tax=Aplysia californica TaxID=6500 RepID=A0ABM0JFV4_APLCA|nr:sodium-coupled monocarboxylate transporter 1-like [Aplysia californica]